MIKRVLPYEGLLHEVVEHNGVLYIGGIVPEDTTSTWRARPATSSPN